LEAGDVADTGFATRRGGVFATGAVLPGFWAGLRPDMMLLRFFGGFIPWSVRGKLRQLPSGLGI
jgi:hypothetical protein